MSVCSNGELLAVTTRRTKQLKQLLNEVEISKLAIINGDKRIMQLILDTIITQEKLINLLIDDEVE